MIVDFENVAVFPGAYSDPAEARYNGTVSKLEHLSDLLSELGFKSIRRYVHIDRAYIEEFNDWLKKRKPTNKVLMTTR